MANTRAAARRSSTSRMCRLKSSDCPCLAVVYQGFLTPLVAYGALAAIVKNRWGKHEREAQKETAETGEEEQL